MTVDADDARRIGERAGPRGAGGTCAASEIDENRVSLQNRLWQRVNDLPDQQKVQRCVEQRKRRAFARTVERATFTETLPPLDIGRRQRPQPRRYLRKGQVRHMAPLRLVQPSFESFVLQMHRSGLPAPS